jgi:hypothetical protein
LATAVRVEAAVPGRKRAGTAEHPVDIDVAEGRLRLGELVAAVVRAEVRAFQGRAEQRRFLRVLTEESLAEGLAGGAVRSGDPEGAPPADVDPDEAVATALLAFEDGLYKVLVDDEPVDDIDALVDLRPDTRLLFLRLVALTGG